MDTLIWGHPVSDWLIALAWAVGTTILLGIAKRVIEQRIAKYAERTETDLDDLLIDLVRRTKPWFLAIVGLWIGSHHFGLADQTYVHAILKLAMAVQGGLWAIGCVDFGIGKMTKGSGGSDPSRKMGANVLGLIGRALVWTGVGLIFLSVVMQEAVTSILTGLGVGGIAVALALQNVLGDMFASITILLDKPFVVGDAIVVGEFNGTVEHIGIKTTRLKSVNGEQIVMGNSDLVHSRIRNYKRLEERRIVFSVGVTYQTPRATLERIPALLKEAVQKAAQVRFDRAHLHKFADFALVYEVAYFVQHPDYQTYMDAQQAINFEILRRFEADKIEFAYPTQVVLQGPAGPR